MADFSVPDRFLLCIVRESPFDNAVEYSLLRCRLCLSFAVEVVALCSSEANGRVRAVCLSLGAEVEALCSSGAGGRLRVVCLSLGADVEAVCLSLGADVEALGSSDVDGRLRAFEPEMGVSRLQLNFFNQYYSSVLTCDDFCICFLMEVLHKRRIALHLPLHLRGASHVALRNGPFAFFLVPSALTVGQRRSCAESTHFALERCHVWIGINGMFVDGRDVGDRVPHKASPEALSADVPVVALELHKSLS